MSHHPIYQLWNGGLGDHWASINLLGRIAESQRTAVHFESKPEHRGRHVQIFGELNLEGYNVVPVHMAATKGLDGFDVWAAQYFKTRRQWCHVTVEPMVCVHFDGESSAADKNPDRFDQRLVEQWCAGVKMEPVYLTGKLDIHTIVSLLSRCALFVGCDSGMSHIAHSVGCPVYLLEYNLPVVTCHRHKNYVLCRGAGEFAHQATNWVRHLRYLGYARDEKFSIDAP